MPVALYVPHQGDGFLLPVAEKFRARIAVDIKGVLCFFHALKLLYKMYYTKCIIYFNCLPVNCPPSPVFYMAAACHHLPIAELDEAGVFYEDGTFDHDSFLNQS
jgi:hypothetical protein